MSLLPENPFHERCTKIAKGAVIITGKEAGNICNTCLNRAAGLTMNPDIHLDKSLEWFIANYDEIRAEQGIWVQAYQINYPGACNVVAVSRILAQVTKSAMDLFRDKGISVHPVEHPAIRSIAGHLAYLLGQSDGPMFDDLEKINKKAKELGIYRAPKG